MTGRETLWAFMKGGADVSYPVAIGHWVFKRFHRLSYPYPYPLRYWYRSLPFPQHLWFLAPPKTTPSHPTQIILTLIMHLDYLWLGIADSCAVSLRHDKCPRLKIKQMTVDCWGSSSGRRDEGTEHWKKRYWVKMVHGSLHLSRILSMIKDIGWDE